jgi:hypothetical protein
MIRIRAATEADLPTLIELVRQFPTPTPSSASELADIVVRKLHDPSAYIFHIAGDLRTSVQKLKDATPAGVLLGSGKLATSWTGWI